MSSHQNRPGKSYPLGATVQPDGVNFCIYAKSASIQLLLFDHQDDKQPTEHIVLDPKKNQTEHYWHIYIHGISAGQLYGWRVSSDTLLVDPYTLAVVPSSQYSRTSTKGSEDNTHLAHKSVVIDQNDGFDWEQDTPLARDMSESVIYEMHIGGFTQDPSSLLPTAKRGTFAGVVEKIPYLKSLGVTAVEFLPIQQFDPQDVPRGSTLTNYWGYSTLAFFSLHSAYCTAHDPQEQIREFKQMVKALHQAGIEVIMDVVFNHTSEGDEDGPTQSYKALAKSDYYITDHESKLSNYTGCGNTINANHPVAKRLILDCLRYWVTQMHIDGFRFDLASSLTRGEDGEALSHSALIRDIQSDPALASTKLIAEPWDASGLYQLGTYFDSRWSEWNDRYRDDVRKFWRGDDNTVTQLSMRITGSNDLFTNTGRVGKSINFITSHDGFTLRDLVSYSEKHNLANLEKNRDGHGHNISWNCGIEGDTTNETIAKLRKQQIKNFLTTLFLSSGVPMILMGDESFRTQLGNNNAYCQDNTLSWMSWDSSDDQQEILAFVRKITDLRLEIGVGRLGSNTSNPSSKVTWHGTKLNQPDWGSHSHSIAYHISQPDVANQFYVIYNAYSEALDFQLPSSAKWMKIIDTSEPKQVSEITTIADHIYHVRPRSAVILKAAK